MSARRVGFGVGDEFSHYRLEEEIGKGGMGVVFRALDLDLDRTVAIKVMAAGAATGKKERDRFTREARNLARVDHPHVLPIHEVKDHEGRLYLAMRLVPSGYTLRGLLRRRSALAPGHALTLLEKVGGALDAMHRADVLHLDVKPENILLEGLEGGEHPWLADFGLARARSDEVTRSDQIVGTVRYMAPEQLGGARDIDAHADLYAFALVLYETLTGHLLDLVQRSRVPESLPENDLVNGRLREVFGRALAPLPAERYESAAALIADARDAFSRAAAPLAMSAPDERTTEPPGPYPGSRRSSSGAEPITTSGRKRRHRLTAALVAAVIVAGLGISAYFIER
ncbi:MAG: serine/threonine-protein kinase, partial [Spirillospora sp.]